MESIALTGGAFGLFGADYLSIGSPNVAGNTYIWGMSKDFDVERKRWRACWQALEQVFERPVAARHRNGRIDLEQLLVQMTAGESDPHWRGRVVIGAELRLAIGALLGKEARQLGGKQSMAELFPGHRRKEQWAQLQQQLEWTLPRIGMPVWGQYLWGLGLLAGLVMMFIWPLWGMLLFFGGIILSFQVEKLAWAFQYRTLDETVLAMVKLNWPSLEMGAADEDHMRLVFADVLARHLAGDMDPRQPFPTISVQDPFENGIPQWHVLIGDELRSAFHEADVHQEFVLMRECFVVGPILPVPEFWERRVEFIASEYGIPPSQYQIFVRDELIRLSNVPNDAEINLWFEDDLFCQVNLWYILAQLHESGSAHAVFRVFQQLEAHESPWKGFGAMDEGKLVEAFERRVELSPMDLFLGHSLWQAFQQSDWQQLSRLAATPTSAFRMLPQVVDAQLKRFPADGGLGEPEWALKAIQARGLEDFESIFEAFTQEEGIYGFGDLQVKSMLKHMK